MEQELDQITMPPPSRPVSALQAPLTHLSTPSRTTIEGPAIRAGEIDPINIQMTILQNRVGHLQNKLRIYEIDNNALADALIEFARLERFYLGQIVALKNLPALQNKFDNDTANYDAYQDVGFVNMTRQQMDNMAGKLHAPVSVLESMMGPPTEIGSSVCNDLNNLDGDTPVDTTRMNDFNGFSVLEDPAQTVDGVPLTTDDYNIHQALLREVEEQNQQVPSLQAQQSVQPTSFPNSTMGMQSTMFMPNPTQPTLSPWSDAAWPGTSTNNNDIYPQANNNGRGRAALSRNTAFSNYNQFTGSQYTNDFAKTNSTGMCHTNVGSILSPTTNSNFENASVSMTSHNLEDPFVGSSAIMPPSTDNFAENMEFLEDTGNAESDGDNAVENNVGNDDADVTFSDQLLADDDDDDYWNTFAPMPDFRDLMDM
ncbi:hypothetical protein H2198_004035 [Neophaeococcomyces mojaviensis]|uniref:Uncharacterized protein n=1 Tax=Neophaeococcomyces mojaviensis TaxID=3383035 RepID=A0ACC3A9M5_9EURO|nr:hypothetical protein H2198_004035 [Knufia sp. JES_112]